MGTKVLSLTLRAKLSLETLRAHSMIPHRKKWTIWSWKHSWGENADVFLKKKERKRQQQVYSMWLFCTWRDLMVGQNVLPQMQLPVVSRTLSRFSQVRSYPRDERRQRWGAIATCAVLKHCKAQVKMSGRRNNPLPTRNHFCTCSSGLCRPGVAYRSQRPEV